MKWFSAIFEGIVGFVMWSFVGFWMGLIPAALLQVSGNTVRIIGVSAAAVLGFVMAVVHARRDLMTHEPPGGRERDGFLKIVVFAFYALAWAALILCVQLGKNH